MEPCSCSIMSSCLGTSLWGFELRQLPVYNLGFFDVCCEVLLWSFTCLPMNVDGTCKIKLSLVCASSCPAGCVCLKTEALRLSNYALQMCNLNILSTNHLFCNYFEVCV